jgi:hypothetical protein
MPSYGLLVTRSSIHARGYRNSQACFRALTVVVASAVLVLTGCTLLPMRNLRPVIAPPIGGACTTTTRALLANEVGVGFQYILPHDANTRSPERAVTDFEAYNAAIQTRVASKLPPALAQHRVTKAFSEFLTSVSAEAQLDAQVSDGTLNLTNTTDTNKLASERALIQKHKVTANLKHSELKNFAKILFDSQLKHGPADFTDAGANLATLGPESKAALASRPRFDASLVAYLKAYYDGKFYDRMGTAVTKPQIPSASQTVNQLISSTPINFSVPDSEIVAAETVLLEFLIDCIDPTPVMGDKDNHPSGTTYYPGGSSNEPTALATGLADYVTLPQDGCGVTLKNVWVLKDLANAASDQAAAVGGLVVNTPGGISLGLGIVGKISIGDNQTLSDLVKTAASDLALRATLATSYFTLRHVTFNPVQP